MNLTAIIASLIIIAIPLGYIIPLTDIICGRDYWWVYTPETIYVCQWDEHYEFYKFHEIWHHIWNNELTEKQKKIYTRIYTLHKKRWITAFEREYSMSDVEEWFCDDFASWQINEDVNNYTQKRINLIKSLFN